MLHNIHKQFYQMPPLGLFRKRPPYLFLHLLYHHNQNKTMNRFLHCRTILVAQNSIYHCPRIFHSKYHVTKWDDSKSYTVDRNNDGKSVTVFTIQNSKKTGKKITFPSSIKVNGKNYKITDIGNYALDNEKGTGLTAVTLPSTINTIGKEAFKGAKNLKSITIKGNLKSVGNNAFSGINKKAVFKIKATEANYKKISGDFGQ